MQLNKLSNTKSPSLVPTEHDSCDNKYMSKWESVGWNVWSGDSAGETTKTISGNSLLRMWKGRNC